VAFVSDHEGARDLYLMNIDGSGVTRLTRGLVVWAQAGWSPGDRQVVFSAQATGKNEIYLINADGSGLRRITFGSEGKR
jgi:TolB protein